MLPQLATLVDLTGCPPPLGGMVVGERNQPSIPPPITFAQVHCVSPLTVETAFRIQIRGLVEAFATFVAHQLHLVFAGMLL